MGDAGRPARRRISGPGPPVLNRPRSCPQGNHEYGERPHSEYAGYQQAADGSRVDGKWCTFHCVKCGQAVDRWIPDAPEDATRLNLEGAWSLRETATETEVTTPNFWERPILLWVLAAIVVIAAVYGLFWDSQLRVSQAPAETSKPGATSR